METLNITNDNCPDPASQRYFAIVTFFACTFNIILFFLIRTSTHNLMKPYLKILYSSVCLDFISAVFQFSTQVRPSIQGERKILTMSMDGFLPALLEKIFDLGANLNYVLVINYFACYSVIVYSLVPFIFRYLIACWNYHMGPLAFSLLFSCVLGTALYASVSISYLCSLVYDYNSHFVPTPNMSCTRYLPQIDARLNMQDPHILFVYKTWQYTALFFEYNYIIILFCAIRVFMFFRRQSLLISTQNKRIQLQLFLTIIIQTAIPLLAYYAQFIVIQTMYLFGLSGIFKNGFLYKTMFLSYSIIPLLNPLAAILLISSYRRTLIDLLFRPFGRIYIAPNPQSNNGMTPSEDPKPETTL